jgi:hypothetical protein
VRAAALPWWRGVLGAAAIALALTILSQWVLSIARLRSGLGAQLVADWGFLLLFVAAATVGGAGLVARLSPRFGRDGFWAISFAAGVTTFGLSMGALGWLSLLGPVSFFALPLAMLAFGWRAAQQRLLDGEPSDPPSSRAALFATAGGAVCLFLVSLQTLSPDNVNFDSAWYHLRAAERYALAGAMVRTPEGDQLLTLPQLNSWIYAWAFLHPIGVIEQKVRLVLLLEFSTFAGTLALLPPLVRALAPSLPRASTRAAWVALFLFPSIFIYDTGIMGGADHVVALFSTAALLVWFQVRTEPGWRGWALFGVVLTGLLAKYSSLYLLAPFIPVVLADQLLAKRGLRGPFISAGVVLALTIPYWARNLLWHHNPVYPLASSIFPSVPWNQDAAAWSLNYKESNVFYPAGSPLHTLQTTLASLVDHQVGLYTWGDMTGGQAIFGSAYFLSVLALPFVLGARRLYLLALILAVGIMVWFNTHQHHMRYLTVLMAPMAAGAAAVAVLAWRQWPAWLGRAAVLTVVGYHLIAFADMPFRKTHRMAGGNSTVGVAIEYVARGGGPTGSLQRWQAIGAALPKNAVPVVHGINPHLGLGRQSLTDVVGLQYGINYGRWGTVPEVYRRLREMGATHLAWGGVPMQPDSVTGEALFYGLASLTVERQQVGGMSLGELPTEPPVSLGDGLLYQGCGEMYASGLYALAQLVEPTRPMYHPFPSVTPRLAVNPASVPPETWTSVTYVVQETGCAPVMPPGPEFTLMGAHDGFPKQLRYFVRTVGVAPTLPAP